MIPEVIKLMKFIIVSPATNAISERSFSALKRLKTSLRSSMTDSRVNNLMMLPINKDFTLDLVKVANEFINRSDYRQFVFGSKIILKS